MTSKPKVSIVIPVWNAEKYIAETLESALNQTFENIEIICIDDCSEDKSIEIIESFVGLGNGKLSLIRLEKNSKTSVARNVGIDAAKGEFILPLDADDLIDETYCEKALRVFSENPRVAVVYCKADRFNDNDSWEWVLPPYSREVIKRDNVVFCSAFFRKSDWVRFGGYNENMNRGFEDWDFWLYFADSKLHFYRISEFLFHYRQVEQSRGVSFNENQAQELQENIKANHPSLYSQPILDKLRRFIFRKRTSFRGYFRIYILGIPTFKQRF